MSKAVEQFKAKCQKFFNECNNGDPITVPQLRATIRSACPAFKGDDNEIIKMFMDIDDDGDKRITWEEFSDALYKKNPKEVTRAELEQTFKDIDADGSGKLNKSEVKAMCMDLGMEASEEQLDAILNEADPDGNGVDFQEFLATWSSSD